MPAKVKFVINNQLREQLLLNCQELIAKDDDISYECGNILKEALVYTKAGLYSKASAKVHQVLKVLPENEIALKILKELLPPEFNDTKADKTSPTIH